MIPSMVVGPSTYAIEHEKSVLVSNIAIDDEGLGGEYAHYDKRLSIKSVVIPPSVDFDRFNPDMIGENDIIRHPKCHQQSAKTCINIGFVGRLAVEKNPGLFLMAAHTILSQDPTVCFTVIGDGDLLPYLRNLAVRLNISGWLDRYNCIFLNMGVCIYVSVKIYKST
jgi:glycosyltransferase involved in cell wall biosynthesis